MIAEDLFDLAPVIPVVVLDDVEAAVPLARALVEGGLPVIEVTLRTPSAPAAIARIAAEVPDAVVGAGTVVRPEDAERSAAAGAKFLVSPGCTARLQAAMVATGLPFLPGVATASEAIALLESGITAMKFFPAEAAGGAAYLKALGGPLPQIRFCPTGGIGLRNAAEYLALGNVGCVGGSWLTPADALRDGDWDRVAKLASEAAALRTT
ncbi:bifunctional 4-hydroxy-2-oxoglutarate aldolase/2-dehydro-3-deoxy-phosphogluconate aldolase [Actinomadura citrea]|jgi:2-dehydro-3-deoxyphosphogluconate aldolase/(4S)-4-hydroxy-2-oxoglutarate aldolase|uniref:2-dehydro-3-deoxy-phosphogluconate aldolase n=1 Tax=Actinomadura citrea TaxID=46158 RepID=A0A7Y9KFM7_9ACTN|nr:bifunctional 4-hydroxy-2-oxoglutarate aldolase/2-dehydro-3-deoxy-phosphogluconate aldolase [Actinomadura citrea]NYE15621.1 2-dehydro-3-deoxyphosphogluconate aldolase/(4S)-4-hydroxy-2-oxoglutarate aldolase [Actinomadura citrea]GGT66096.1 ketohydroxyglutarate aldolase [Actinomadura citrea]